jgi:hypothetical protein
MRSAFSKICYSTVTPLFLAFKHDPELFGRLFERPQPEQPSPLRPLLVAALEAGIPYGSFGMCSEYIEELGKVYTQLVPIASKGHCAGLLPWTEAAQGLNFDRVRTSDAHESSILAEALGLASIFLPRNRLATLERASTVLEYTRPFTSLVFRCATVLDTTRRHSPPLASAPPSPTTLDSTRPRLAHSCASVVRTVLIGMLTCVLGGASLIGPRQARVELVRWVYDCCSM